MPPARNVLHAESVALREIGDEIEQAIDYLARSEGAPDGAKPLSDAEQLRQWGITDPNLSDPDGMALQLQQGGLAQFPEMLDPNNPKALAIVRANPDIATMYAEPLDAQVADMMVRLAEYPLRLSLMAPYQDDPQEMVNYAKRMDARWQKSLGINLRMVEPTLPLALEDVTMGSSVPTGPHSPEAPMPAQGLPEPAAPPQMGPPPDMAMMGG